MTGSRFAELLGAASRDVAIEGVISSLQRPSGRFPPKDVIDRAAWYNALSPEAQAIVESIVKLSAEYTLFGCLAVLDGCRPIFDGTERVSFELHAAVKGNRFLVNDPSKPPLHECI